VSWTETEDQLLQQLVSEGLPTREIGKRLGRTRNAVCGRVFRLRKLEGVEFTLKPKVSAPKPGRPRKPRKVKPIDAPKNLWESIFDLGNNDCRFPVGAKFCCKPKKEGSSYCQEHYDIAYYVRGK
jgi:hypothetical protein